MFQYIQHHIRKMRNLAVVSHEKSFSSFPRKGEHRSHETEKKKMKKQAENVLWKSEGAGRNKIMSKYKLFQAFRPYKWVNFLLLTVEVVNS